VSHNLLIDPTYTDPLREWLGPFLPGSLLILDEAHHAAPASGGGAFIVEDDYTSYSGPPLASLQDPHQIP
jgi:hypothetical protein